MKQLRKMQQLLYYTSALLTIGISHLIETNYCAFTFRCALRLCAVSAVSHTLALESQGEGVEGVGAAALAASDRE